MPDENNPEPREPSPPAPQVVQAKLAMRQAIGVAVIGAIGVILAAYFLRPPKAPPERPPIVSGSLIGRWCGPFDNTGVTEVLNITQQAAANVSGTSNFIDRFGVDKGGHSMLQGDCPMGLLH
jgi:hypothetical protein